MAARTELVELVEDDEPGRGTPESAGPAGGPPDPVERSRAWLRRHWRWLVPSVAALVVVLVGTQSVADAREKARLERLAAVPGVLAPVSSHLHVLWRGNQDVGTLVQQGSWVDGMFVGGISGSDGTLSFVALDARTGKRVWTTHVQAPEHVVTANGEVQQTYSGCFVVPRDEAVAARRSGPDWLSSTTSLPAAKVLATCVAQQIGSGIDGPSDVSIFVLDPSDGTLVRTSVLPGGAQLALVSNDLVSATPADGVWHVAVTDLATGRTAWTFDTTSEQAVTPAGDAGSGAPGASPQLLATDDGGLIVVTPAGHLTRLDSTGHVERTGDVPPLSYVGQSRAGALLTSLYSSGTTTGTLEPTHGGTVTIHGNPVPLTIDDGSAGDVVLVSDPDQSGADTGITALSGSSGRTLWTRDGSAQAALLLGGTLYLAGSDSISAVDARTGAERWSHQVDYSPQALGTDGTALLVSEPSTKLTGYALRTGVQEWTQRLGEQVAGHAPAWTVQNLDLTGGKRAVVAYMDDGSVVVLG